MWEIKGKNNQVKATINSLEYNGEWMGESYVTVTVESPAPVNFEIGDYIIYRDERFEINYDPGKIKSAPRYEKGDAFKYENIKFNSLADELTRCDFLDIVLNDNQLHFTGLPKFSFYGGVKDLANRMQANLDRTYGKGTWSVVVSPEFQSTKEVNISVDTIKVQGALSILVNDLETYYTIKGRTITIGAAGIPAGHLFKYGKGNGLYEIEQNAEADQAIVTRLRAYGSTRNLPHRYYNSLSGADGQKLIPDNMAVQNLMLPEFPYTTQDPYIDSPNVAKLGIREGTVFFDGSGELEEIYPSIEGMTAEQLKAAGVPCNSTGALDEIVSAEQMTDNGVGEINEGETQTTAKPPTFKVTLKDLGFDINDHKTTETATISFKTGMLGGRDFEIVGCKKIELGGKVTGYELELNRVYDDSIKLWFPYSAYNAQAGDKFVLLYIEMPEVYIKAAAQKLKDAATEWLSKNDYSRSIYAPKVDEIFMARQHDLAMASGGKIKSLHDTLKEGMLLLFEDEDLNIDASIFIDRLTIKEEGAVPTYEVVLKEEKTVGRLDKMQNQIDSLAAGKGQGGGGYTAAQIRSMIDAYGGTRFLSKIKDDRTPYKISTDKAFEVGEYLAGVSGGIFGKDANGDSFAEVARLYVRVKAFFEELTVVKAGVLAGKQYITPGGGIRCTRVEEVTDGSGSLTAYRCWFLSGQDGENTECMYSSGDQAISEMFNAVAGTSNKVSNHRYWRLVTAVKNDAYADGSGNHYGYIDLSKTDCEPGSDTPQEGDEICQLGSRNDKTRQTAMVFSTVDADAPSVKLYSGIDSYSLAGKAVVSFGRDPITGRIFFRLGADGDRQYLRYSQDGGLEVAGKISSKSTYDDGSGSDATLGDVINDRIADTDILFIAHTSQTVAPVLPLLAADGTIAQLNGWTTDAPAAQAGLYIWQTTYVLRGDGTASFVGTSCTTGRDGSSYTENLVTGSRSGIGWIGYTRLNDGVFEKDNSSTTEKFIFAPDITVEAGKKYTLSFQAKATANLRNADLFLIGEPGFTQNSFSPTTQWQSFSFVNTSPQSRSGAPRFDNNASTDGATATLYIRDLKIEEGENSNPVWTPNSSEMIGTDAYTVLLTNESHTFAGDSEKAVASSTDCGIVAYKGATQVVATIGAISGMPSGMTAAVSGNGTTAAKFTVSVTTALTQRQGTLSVPVTVDGKTFDKVFSWSLSLDGERAHNIYLKGCQANNLSHYRIVRVDGGVNIGPDNRRGIRVVTFNRQTLKMVNDYVYDTYADTPSSHPYLDGLITFLKARDSSVFVTLTSADAMSLSQELIDELANFGGMIDTVVWQNRHAFAFIGYKGLQPGYAQWMIDKTVGTSTSAPAEVSVYIADGMFTTSKTQTGVKSITEEYYLSTSRDTPAGGSWSAVRPAWVAGHFYWTRTKVTYTDGTFEYKGEICATGETGQGYTTNMLTGTKDWSGWRVDNVYSRNGIYLGLDVMHGTSPSSGYRDLILVGKTDLEADTIYTLSVWAKGTGSFTTYVYENVTAQILNIDGIVSSSSASNTEASYLLTPQWKRHYVVFRTIAGITLTGRHLIASRLFADGSEIWVAGAKLEKGENHDTQWSPYPSEQYGRPGVDATFSPNLVPSAIYDPEQKGGGLTNAVKWIPQCWTDSASAIYRINLIGWPIKEAGWYSVYFMARRVSGAGAVSVDINDCGITVTPDLSTIDGNWRAFSGKVYVNQHIGVNGFIDFMNGDGIELSDITVTRGEAVPASWLPTAPELTGGSDNLLMRSDVEVSNAGYPIASYRIAETLNNNEMLTCTIWGDLKGGSPRWGLYNSSGSHFLQELYRVADGVYSATVRWVTNTDTNNDTLVVYPMDRTDTSAVSTIRRIKFERGLAATPWSRSSHDFDFITAALKQNTEIDGGLILSALMKLGVKDASGVRRIMAGINGLVNSSDDLALWAGGDMVDADKFPTDAAKAAAAIRHNGTAYFANNVIRMFLDYMMVGDNVRLDKDGLKLMVDGDTSLEITNRDVYTDFNKLASNKTRFSYNARVGPSIGVESGNSVIVEETYDAVSLGEIEAGTQVVVNIALEGVQDSRNFGNGSVNSPFSQPLTVIAYCGSTAVHQTTMPVHSMTVTHNDADGRPSWSEHTYSIRGTTTFTASKTGAYEIEITFLKESSAAMLGWFSLEGTMSGFVKLALSNQMTIGRNGLSVIRNNNALAINDSMIVMRSDRFGFALHPTLGPVITLNSGTNWYAAQLSNSQILFNKRVTL